MQQRNIWKQHGYLILQTWLCYSTTSPLVSAGICVQVCVCVSTCRSFISFSRRSLSEVSVSSSWEADSPVFRSSASSDDSSVIWCSTHTHTASVKHVYNIWMYSSVDLLSWIVMLVLKDVKRFTEGIEDHQGHEEQIAEIWNVCNTHWLHYKALLQLTSVVHVQ